MPDPEPIPDPDPPTPPEPENDYPESAARDYYSGVILGWVYLDVRFEMEKCFPDDLTLP